MFKSLRMKFLVSHALITLLTIILIGISVSVILVQFRKDMAVDKLSLDVRRSVAVLNTRSRELQKDDGAASPEFVKAAQDYMSDIVQSPERLLLVDRVDRNSATVSIIRADTGPQQTLIGQPVSLEGLSPNVRNENVYINNNIYFNIYTSKSDGQEWYYAASPIRDAKGRWIYTLIVAERPEDVFSPWQKVGSKLLIGALIAFILTGILSWFLARSLVKPILRVAAASEEMVEGNYQQALPVQGRDEIAHLAESFNRMAAAVNRSDLMQREFIANVSHEMRTPLTSILGFSQAMLDGTLKDTEGYNTAAGIVQDESRRLLRLVNQLLILSKLQSGQMTIEHKPVDLGEVARTVAAGFQIIGQEKELQIISEVTSPLIVEGDYDRLQQVLTNLVDNASRHTPPGGVVRIYSDVVRGRALVVIEDSGEGIPAEAIPRLFERFYQVDKSRQYNPTEHKGVGLGLSIVREIVEAHHGEIKVTSQMGKGTSITISLPLALASYPGTGSAKGTNVDKSGRSGLFRLTPRSLPKVPPPPPPPPSTLT